MKIITYDNQNTVRLSVNLRRLAILKLNMTKITYICFCFFFFGKVKMCHMVKEYFQIFFSVKITPLKILSNVT